jgi:hypothetical protein
MIAAAMGWIGTVGGISAYVLLSRGRWDATSLRYSALNGLAGVLAGGASVAYGAWPSVGANVIWTAVAVHSAATTLRARRSQPATLAPVPAVDYDPEPPTGPQPTLAAA